MFWRRKKLGRKKISDTQLWYIAVLGSFLRFIQFYFGDKVFDFIGSESVIISKSEFFSITSSVDQISAARVKLLDVFPV